MMTLQSSIITFYGWWEMVTCLFAFIGLLSIWYHLGRKKGDFGQVWLALSILSWSISGAVELYFASDQSNSLYIQGWRSIFSLVNSLLILFALPWFRHRPKWLSQLLSSKSWYFIVGLPFIFSLLPTVSRMITGSGDALISELDVYYAVLTLIMLGFILWESFINRGLQLLAYLSVVFVLVTLAAQLYKFTDDTETLILISAIFKSLLIMIFFALALSWVKDLSESLKLDSSRMSLRLTQVKLENGKHLNTVTISGIEGSKSHEVNLTTRYYELLQSFILAKQDDPRNGWLEIKPKGDQRGIDYPIKDYNEIKRLVTAILDGIFGKGLWDKERHELPIKDALFEFRKDKGRMIRLRVQDV